jgi:hypothetical protein
MECTLFGKRAKQGQLSLSEAILELDKRAETLSKVAIYKQKGCVPPGSWITLYKEIKNKLSISFWEGFKNESYS